MALVTTPLGAPLAYSLTEDDDLDTAGVTNIRNGPCTLYAVELVAATEDPEPLYAKFYNQDGSALTFGTTAPVMIIPVEEDTAILVVIPGGLPFTSGLSAAGCSEDGSAVTTEPDSAFRMRAVTADN